MIDDDPRNVRSRGALGAAIKSRDRADSREKVRADAGQQPRPVLSAIWPK